MSIHPLAGQLAPKTILVNVPELISAIALDLCDVM